MPSTRARLLKPGLNGSHTSGLDKFCPLSRRRLGTRRGNVYSSFVFRRSEKPQTTPAEAIDDEQPEGGRKAQSQAPKGYATPSRKEAEAARKARLGALPTDPKLRRKAERGQRNSQFQRERQAVREGDERHYPVRDFGPARAYVRDYVDGRLRLLEFLMPLVVLSYLSLFLGSAKSSLSVLPDVLMPLIVLFGFVFGLMLSFRVKKAVAAQFGPDDARGTGFYAFSRAIMPRVMRSPKPKLTLTGQPKQPK
jgi:hypothetical protein